MILEMVNFSFIPVGESKSRPEMKKTLQKVDQLVKWDYSDEQGTYTGLIVISQKAVPRGLKTTAKITLDAASKSLPMRKIQELSRLVQNQLVARKLLEPRSLQ